MWTRMLERVDDFRAGRVPLGQLVSDLRGLFVEADPHDASIRSDFESAWAPIDMVLELRTEAWAPAGSASDEALEHGLDGFATWVESVLARDTTTDHG